VHEKFVATHDNACLGFTEGREYLDQLREYKKVTNVISFLKSKNTQVSLLKVGLIKVAG
jgi:ssRNA-specific RNase YbeY (16S rRNA maturation enzyme)